MLLLYRSSCQVNANSQICSAISVSFRGWCRLGGPGEWNGLFTGEPVLVQRSTDRIDSSAAQRTDLDVTQPPPSSTSTQPATAGTALTRDKPHLPRAALLVFRLASNRPPTVTADAHQCCQVAAQLVSSPPVMSFLFVCFLLDVIVNLTFSVKSMGLKFGLEETYKENLLCCPPPSILHGQSFKLGQCKSL